MRRPFALAAVVFVIGSASASAGIFFHRHEHEERPHPTPEPGEKRHFCHNHERAGGPLTLSNHLEPTNAGDFYGYYVGGGGGHGSGTRCREEGTFGWDYTGVHFPRRVILGWNHGTRYQGGSGYYKTDGPFEVPNIFEAELPKIHHHGEEAEGGHWSGETHRSAENAPSAPGRWGRTIFLARNSASGRRASIPVRDIANSPCRTSSTRSSPGSARKSPPPGGMPLDELEVQAAEAPPVRDFRAALEGPGPIRLIAEVKKASPSAGVIREDFDPIAIARTYQEHGAACLSVLTDAKFFQGHLTYLARIRASVAIPLLRKDFTIDEYQVVEARMAGADAVLLIAEILDDDQLAALLARARSLGMSALVEFHDAANLPRVLKSGADLIGINNRDLTRFVTDLDPDPSPPRPDPPDVILVGEAASAPAPTSNASNAPASRPSSSANRSCARPTWARRCRSCWGWSENDILRRHVAIATSDIRPGGPPMTRSSILLCLALSGATAPDDRTTWTFEYDKPGAMPTGFKIASGVWKVVEADKGRVLAQTASSPDDVFNVAFVDGSAAKDVDLSVRLKAVAGKDDRGGGLVWRARDAKNYYIARYNHLEDNYRVYKVVDGKRTMFKNADIPHDDAWHTIRVTMTGDHIECYYDDKKVLEVDDSTFPDSGTIGVWSKADARSWFDDLMLVTK